jgi:uncharacterized lipoprotein YmbA
MVVAALLLAAGCSFFSKSKSKFFSLDRIPPAAAPAAGTARAPIGIGGIELPPGFDRREIVIRKANHQMEVRASDQWSAGLQDLVLHTLAFDLADRLPEGTVILPGAAQPAAMRSIDVVFEDLSAGPDAKVTLDARWTATAPALAGHEQIVIDIPSLDSANVATGTSQAIAALADRIAAKLR